LIDPLSSSMVWRCEECVEPLVFTQLWQHPVTSLVYCAECWANAFGLMAPTLPPRMCDECLALLPSVLFHPPEWNGQHESVDLCEGCAAPVSVEEEAAAVDALRTLLEDQ
jgi:hypothetical protein